MEIASVSDLGAGVTCLDAHYVKPGVACFYLLEEAREFAVIETGNAHSVPLLMQHLEQRGVTAEQVRYVIPTHVHLDHAGGAGAMMARFPEAELLVHPRGARHMADPGKLIDSAKMVYGEEAFTALYGDIMPIAVERIREIEDGEELDLNGRPLVFRHTRGHANHHMCIWDARSQGWFTGDMFGVSYPWFQFAAGDFILPSTTPTQFAPEDYLQSLDLLASYQPQRMFLTHFGERAYTEQGARLLRDQVLRYCELGREFAPNAEALQAALSDYAVSLLSEMAIDVPEETLREWVSLDAPLNTQGLLHWLS